MVFAAWFYPCLSPLKSILFLTNLLQMLSSYYFSLQQPTTLLTASRSGVACLPLTLPSPPALPALPSQDTGQALTSLPVANPFLLFWLLLLPPPLCLCKVHLSSRAWVTFTTAFWSLPPILTLFFELQLCLTSLKCRGSPVVSCLSGTSSCHTTASLIAGILSCL